MSRQTCQSFMRDTRIPSRWTLPYNSMAFNAWSWKSRFPLWKLHDCCITYTAGRLKLLDCSTVVSVRYSSVTLILTNQAGSQYIDLLYILGLMTHHRCINQTSKLRNHLRYYSPRNARIIGQVIAVCRLVSSYAYIYIYEQFTISNWTGLREDSC